MNCRPERGLFGIPAADRSVIHMPVFPLLPAVPGAPLPIETINQEYGFGPVFNPQAAGSLDPRFRSKAPCTL